MNAATQYGVQIVRANETEYVWRCTSVRHLTPSENRGKRNVYVDVLDENGNRDRDSSLRIGWFDHDGDTTPAFTALDKPDTPMELGDGNVDLYANQTMSIWMAGYGLASDMVTGIHTRHADEPGPNGETWNSYGHHSFKVVFQEQRLGQQTDDDEKPPMDDENTALAAQVAANTADIEGLRRALGQVVTIMSTWTGD